MIPSAPGCLQSDCQPWAQHRNSRGIVQSHCFSFGSALQLQRGYCRVIIGPGLITATSEELCRVIVFLWLSTSTPERLLQSDCQPWAQHRNSREISAESLFSFGSTLQLQRDVGRVIVCLGLNISTSLECGGV